jgi:hypothetical protein
MKTDWDVSMAHDFCSIARVASAAPAASFKPRYGKSLADRSCTVGNTARNLAIRNVPTHATEHTRLVRGSTEIKISS